MVEVTYGEYKGSKTIILPLDDEGGRTFIFGTNKARAIIKYFKEIEKFVVENKK